MSFQVLQGPKGQPNKRWDIFAKLKEAHVILKIDQNMNKLPISNHLLKKKCNLFENVLCTRYCRVLRDNLRKGGISLPD